MAFEIFGKDTHSVVQIHLVQRCDKCCHLLKKISTHLRVGRNSERNEIIAITFKNLFMFCHYLKSFKKKQDIEKVQTTNLTIINKKYPQSYTLRSVHKNITNQIDYGIKRKREQYRYQLSLNINR